MPEVERTLVLVKPDAVQRGLIGEILSRLDRTGLKPVALKMLRIDREMAERHYAAHRDQPYFEGLVQFITSGPIIAAVYEGYQALDTVRSIMGATDPIKAEPGTIRADLAQDTRHNLVHGSDSVESAEQEIDLFFSPEEILS